ncbi:MAG TPA: IS481 family transposase [Gammaproteobacteria bacterium]|jgi:transposase InsO family protein|nr:IS481 family transposase [Gammaproteobacteria bacterium]
MPWKPVATMNLRSEFIQLALNQTCPFNLLCERFHISRKTGYKWLARYQQDHYVSLDDQSRRPLYSPARTADSVVQQVIALRHQHPAWGGRKIHHRLVALGVQCVPAPSTITDILRRNSLISDAASELAQPWQRFEHDHPNSLWQIDFKGYFDTASTRCHPLTLLDDHSRFNLTLTACAQPNTDTVKTALTSVFERYGLPVRINADNGAPWGSPRETQHGLTTLTVWLIRLGIRISHSRPYHPQTNGKDERFHRTLNAEVLNGQAFHDLAHAQRAFDQWRPVYNEQRPHEALNYQTPVSRYQPSQRTIPQTLPDIEYSQDDHVITVGWDGVVKFARQKFKVSNALQHLPIALRADPEQDGAYHLFFCHQRFGSINLQDNECEP